MSKLTYLITLWGGAQQYLLSALQVQQLAAGRAVCGFGCWGWSRKKLLDKVGWLSVKQLVFFHTALQAHKTNRRLCLNHSQVNIPTEVQQGGN